MSKYYPIIDTVGLEIESQEICSHKICDRLNTRVWKIDHDASVESDARITGEFIVTSSPTQRPQLSSSGVTKGVEIVLNPPYSLEDQGNGELLDELCTLTELLAELGDLPKSPRAGVHVHISMPISLQLLKTYLKVGAYLEDVFFALGCNGYTFRGMLANESAYCRPITKWGPPCVPTGSNKMSQVFTIDRAMGSKTTQAFWWGHGNITMSDMINRYHPSRYTWLNLYSLLAHGTLEFRVFNTTHNPYLIMNEVLFCQAVAKYCLNVVSSKISLDSFEEHSVFDERPTRDILGTFNEFCSSAGVDSKIQGMLSQIIITAPPVILNKSYIKTHLRQERGYDFSDCPNTDYLRAVDVRTIEVQDIHHLRGEH